MPSLFSIPIRADGVGGNNNITSLDSDGFSLAADVATNGNGNSHAYLAIKDDGGGDFGTITYTGDAADDKLVNSIASPTFALIKSNSGIVGAEKFAGQASATATITSNVASMNFQGGGDRSDLIYFGTDGIRVSNGSTYGANLVNVNAVAHYGWWFKDRTGYVKAGSFTGTGSTQSIYPGFFPGVVFTRNAIGSNPMSFYNSETAGNSQAWDGNATTTNITGVGRALGNFNVGTGTDSNGNGNTIWYLALVDPTSLPVSDTRNARVAAGGGTTTRNAHTKGLSLASDTRNARTHGVSVQNDTRAAHIKGLALYSDIRSGRVKGQSVGSDTRSAHTKGLSLINDIRNARTHGLALLSDIRSGRTHGVAVTFDTRSGRTHGLSLAADLRNARIKGLAVLSSLIFGRAKGQALASSKMNAHVRGAIIGNTRGGRTLGTGWEKPTQPLNQNQWYKKY